MKQMRSLSYLLILTRFLQSYNAPNQLQLTNELSPEKKTVVKVALKYLHTE